MIGSGSQGKPRSGGGTWHSLNLRKKRTVQTTGTRGPARMKSKYKSPGAEQCVRNSWEANRMNEGEHGRQEM